MNYLGHNLETMVMELNYGNLNGWCVCRAHELLRIVYFMSEIVQYLLHISKL